MDTQKIIINAPKDIHKKLKTMAFMEETTMTEIILKEIKKVLKKYEESKK
ncbi:MAG: hypothetical protein KKF12_12295 [Proteobacteria bacterium]|nr:hypothetical protein [Pseudomonadota bacterium]MBU4009512.1 hypothetical protein [Pseudomonadota bacterium]MBU4131593.1 hypothetical protein [Pseudomonadota bacterium]